MSEIRDLTNIDGIAFVEKSDIPGVDYKVIAEEGVGQVIIRSAYLKGLRDEYKIVGTSKNWADRQFMMFAEKDQ